MSGWTCTAPRPGALLYASGPIEILADAAGVSMLVWGTGRARGLRIGTIDDLSRVEREVVDLMAEPAREGVRATALVAWERHERAVRAQEGGR